MLGDNVVLDAFECKCRILLSAREELDLLRLETSGCSFGGVRVSIQD
jgi:hypothetical protein